jgi:hypothetical protein
MLSSLNRQAGCLAGYGMRVFLILPIARVAKLLIGLKYRGDQMRRSSPPLMNTWSASFQFAKADKMLTVRFLKERNYGEKETTYR